MCIRDSNGSTRGTGHIQAGKELAINPGHVLTEIEGTPGKDPAFGLDAVWIDPADSEYAQASGYTVVDTATVMATHLNSVIKDNAEELMTYDVAQELINKIEESSPKLIEDFIPDKLALGTIVRVLQNLLKEGVPLRDMRTILETLAEECDKTQDAGELSSLVRPKLGRLILQELVEVDETLGQLLVAEGFSTIDDIKDSSLEKLLVGKDNPETLPNIMFDITAKDVTDITNVIPMLKKAGYQSKNIHLTWVLTNYVTAMETVSYTHLRAHET